MEKKLFYTLDKYRDKLQKLGRNTFYPLEYNGSTEKLVAVCKVCGYLILARSADALSMRRHCEECRRLSILDRDRILKGKLLKYPALPNVKRHTIETYQDVVDKRSYLDVELLTFKNIKSKCEVLLRCCGNTTEIIASNLLKVKYCKFCNPEFYQNTKEDLQRVSEFYGFEVLDCNEAPKYRDVVKVKYSCGCTKETLFGSLCEGKGVRCLICEKRVSNLYITQDEAEERLKALPFSNYTIVGEYNGVSNKCRVVCKDCGYESNESVDALEKRISGCRVCGRTGSFKERLLLMMLYDKGFRFSSQKTFKWLVTDKGNMFYDVYLEDYSVAIEYDGEYHRSEDVQRLDRIKDKLSEENGVKVYRIMENESVVDKVNDIISCLTTIP